MTTEHIFAPGTLVADRYLIQNKLGKGGMGEVFLAMDQSTGQAVALKTLHAKYASSKHATARFVREVKTSRSLDHPGIVKIYDARKWGDILFYTMEYIDGKSLRRWLQQRQKLELGNAVRVLCLVADALSHAHRITIHRDLSPENIMVLRDGSIRLLDFGLAKLDDQFKGLTMVGVNLGKLQYMAPEQQVNPAGVDHRADIYPLGIMFFEMLTGRPPQPGQKLSALCPELPHEVDDFMAKATAPDPEQRFATARAFRMALVDLYKIAQGRAQRPAEAVRSDGIVGRIKAFIARLLRRAKK